MKSLEAYNFIDIFIIGTLLVTLILGLWKGFIRALTAVAGLVVGVVAATKYYPVVQPYLAKISSLDPHISMILSMVAVFIFVQVVFVLIRRGLAALIDVTKLSWLDRVLGGLMGSCAGLMIVAVAVHAVLLTIPEWPVVGSSRLVKPVSALSAKVLNYAPKQARNYVQSLMVKLQETQEPSQPRQPSRSAPHQKAPAIPPGPGK
jgi:membrane protein required for colicin V production